MDAKEAKKLAREKAIIVSQPILEKIALAVGEGKSSINLKPIEIPFYVEEYLIKLGYGISKYIGYYEDDKDVEVVNITW